MKENIEQPLQSQIYQSFTNFNNDSINNKDNSPNKESFEFTFKKNICDSNKSKHSEKSIDHNIYSKNDENIIQSGHFCNEDINESKFKILLKKIKENNNIIKPLFNLIIQKKKNIKKLNSINKSINMKNLSSLNKIKINTLNSNRVKRELKINNNTNMNKPNNNSNVITIKNNNKYIFNFLSKESLNTFLEISHESNDNDYNDNNKINIIENKENINSQNKKIKYKNNINLNKKIYNELLRNKSADKKNKSRNKDKSKKGKFEKNCSFDILKNEYKELKQKINENKKINKKHNKLYPSKSTFIKDKNNRSEKKLMLTRKIIRIKSTTYHMMNNSKKDIKNNNNINIKNMKLNKLTLINLKTSNNNNLNNYNNKTFNSHRRMNSISIN